MKTLDEVFKTLLSFEKTYGMPVIGCEQQSEAWFKMKLGVISASNASRAVAKSDSETRLTYLCDLVAEVCTGVIEEMNFKQVEWGKEHEDAARSSYELATGLKISKVPFVFRDESHRAGCSPDGFVGEMLKGLEAKCPWDSANYVKFLIADKMKTEWVWQNEMSMWVCGADQWDICQYDPRMHAKPIVIRTVEKDLKRQATLDDAIPQLIHDMDKMLGTIGVKFGSQWARLAVKAAV